MSRATPRRHRSQSLASRAPASPRLLESLESRTLFAAGFLLEFNGVDLTPNDFTPSVADGTDFGGVLQGAPAVRHVFTVTNTGDADLEVFAAGNTALDTFAVDDSALGNGPATPIAPGGQVSITVDLVSEKPGLKEDDLSFRTNDPSLPSIVRYRIRGFVESGAENLGTVGDAPVVDAATVSLGESQDGAGSHPTRHVPRTVRFSLAGPTASNLTVGARITDAGEFDSDLRLILTRDTDADGVLDLSEYNNPEFSRLVAHDGGRVVISRAGLPAGQYLVHTAVEDSTIDVAGADVQYELDLSAEAVPAPDARVRFGSTDIADGDGTPTAADGTDFGAAPLGGDGPQRTFTVTNTGGSTLNLPGAVDVPAGFDLVSGLPPTLAPGASADFVVKLESGSAGAKIGQISFATNAPGENPFNFSVSGTVTQDGTPPPPPPPPPPPSGPISIASVDAAVPPTVIGGEKRAKGTVTVRLSNTGPDLLNGPVSVQVFASSDAVVSPADDIPVGTFQKTLKIKAGAQKAVKVKLPRIPAPPADGDYLLLAQVSSGGGNVATGQGPSVRIERPFVDLIGQAAAPAALSFGRNATIGLPVLNAGNVPAKGLADVQLFVSLDGTLEEGRSFALDTLGGVKVSVKPAATKPVKLKLAVPESFPAPFAAGSYFLVAELTAQEPLGSLNVSNGGVLGAVPFSIA